jgi:hypothetical protein
MLDDILFLLVALLIVMPVVAILLMGLQPIGRFDWKPQVLAVAVVAISVGLVVLYILLN